MNWGNEAMSICSTNTEDWDSLDMMLEVGTDQNRNVIFEHCKNIGLNMFSQKKDGS